MSKDNSLDNELQAIIFSVIETYKLAIKEGRNLQEVETQLILQSSEKLKQLIKNHE